MRAIIETGGKQFTVAQEETIRVPSLDGEPGDEVTFERVLYASDDGDVRVGSPTVDGATVTAEIVKHGRGEKITVFKRKRRKRYRRKQGHRQNFTELRITDVELGEKPASRKEPEAPETEVEAAAAEETTGFVCDLCGNEYDTERGLKVHKTRSHKDEKEKE
ncbi:MAG: 50S ribosomal protein L21 [Gemmatimonadota bacterium]|nr:50S ribosomal protein L21 [Gemmatimonadota bacterium]